MKIESGLNGSKWSNLNCHYDDRLTCDPSYGVCVMKEEKRKFIFDKEVEVPINISFYSDTKYFIRSNSS